MTARRWALVIAAAVAVYLVLTAWRGVAFLAAPSIASRVLGLAVLVLPLIGAGLIIRELRFGQQVAALGERLARDGGLPLDDLPRRPSGRVERAAADARAAEAIADVEASPGDWRCWYRLGIAYDDAADRTRARAAMRRAIALAAEN